MSIDAHLSRNILQRLQEINITSIAEKSNNEEVC